MKRFFLVFLLLTMVFLSAQEIEYLKTGDVNKVMNELFAKHIDKKAMNEDLFKTALEQYVEQFDPRKIYLLQGEVEPLIDPPKWKLKQYVDQYNRKNLSPFVKIDEERRMSEEITTEMVVRDHAKRIIEALLFASNHPLSARKIQNILLSFHEFKMKEVIELIHEFGEELNLDGRPVKLEEIGEGFLLKTERCICLKKRMEGLNLIADSPLLLFDKIDLFIFRPLEHFCS